MTQQRINSVNNDGDGQNVSDSAIMAIFLMTTLLLDDMAERDPELRGRLLAKVDSLSQLATGKKYPASIHIMKTMLHTPEDSEKA